jgi:hypothetical protein
MATFSEKNLARQAVDSSIETLYTVPASTVAIVKDIHICNNGATNRWVNIWLVPSGDSPTDENIIFFEWDVLKRDFAHWTGFQTLDTAGDTIQAQSETADQITITISGAEIS